MKQAKLIAIIAILVVIIASYFIVREYSSIKYYEGNTESLYMYEFDHLFPYFITNDVIVDGKPLNYVQYCCPKDTIYIIPKPVFQKAEAMVGYGIREDISFEESFSKNYNKPSYGYDCTSPNIILNHPKCHFAKECIGTTKFALPDFKCSGIIHTFDEMLKRNNLIDKKIFIRMDIAGAEVKVMNQILKHSKDITGLALVIHCDEFYQFEPTIQMLKNIEKDFVLVQRHTQPVHAACIKKFESVKGKGFYSPSMVLTYINKNLIDSYNVSQNQKSIKKAWAKDITEYYPTDVVMWRMVPTIIRKNIQKLISFDLPRLFSKYNICSCHRK